MNKTQIRTHLTQLSDIQMFRVLDRYLLLTNSRLQKNTKEISYKCFECQCKIKNKSAVGFGRNESETLVNAVRNLMEMVVEDQRGFTVLKEIITGGKGNQMQYRSNNVREMEKENIPLKEDIFEYININTQKIRNPNISAKVNSHENYLSQSVNSNHSVNELNKAHAQIRQLQQKIKQALVQNQKLKHQKGKMTVDEIAGETVLDALEYKIHAKVRSISVEPGANFKSMKPQSVMTQSTFTNTSLMEDKKETQQQQRRVPRLKLQVLPNYHGKSNKSLNQSLLEAYTKGKR